MTHTKEPQQPGSPDTGVIRARVDNRLLAKADRLFTGATEGRAHSLALGVLIGGASSRTPM